MKQSRNETLAYHSFNLLNQLHDPKAKQYLEWSVTLTADKFELRNKPTLYVYPNEDYNAYQNLNKLLHKLNCPEELIRIHKHSFATSMYQGIRIPDINQLEKCLYIHHQGVSHIDCYRWKNQMHYDNCNYVYYKSFDLNHTFSVTHGDLTPFLEKLIKAEQFVHHFGVWFQESKEEIREVYYSFPNRTRFNWVVKAFENLLNKDVYQQSLKFRNFKFKNIGFDSTLHQNSPAITIYFTLPITEKFPNDYKELIRSCSDFFDEN